MSRVAHLITCAGVGAALLISSRAARAWDSPEHRASVGVAYAVSCANHQDLPFCKHSDPTTYDKFNTLAKEAGAAPDFCHSFWFSDVGISINDTNKENREKCWILDGVPNSDRLLLPIDRVERIVYTNTNHFGDHAVTHAKFYLNLALEAARRYAHASDENKNICAEAAVGLAGFADHYMTDRTAAGHAWTPLSHGMIYSQQVSKAVGMLGCFHGQTTLKRDAISLGTGFHCWDDGQSQSPTVGQEFVWDGLGRTGRRFASPFFASGQLWWSDEAWDDHVAGDGDQFIETTRGAGALFDDVFDVMLGHDGSDPATVVRDTFVSNQEMCSLVWGNCCRSFTISSDTVEPTCNYCPDISDEKIKSMCPVDSISRNVMESTNGRYNKLVYGTAWKKVLSVPVLDVPPKQYFRAYLATPPGGMDGADVARQIAVPGDDMARTAEAAVVHPDAQWDRDNDVVTLLGCPEVSQ